MQHEIRQSPETREKLSKASGQEYKDTVRISSLVETIQRHAGPEKIAGRIKRSLKGLREELLLPEGSLELDPSFFSTDRLLLLFRKEIERQTRPRLRYR